MKIASVEYENGVSQLLNSRFDKNDVMVNKFDNLEDLIGINLKEYDLILVDMTHNKCLQVIQHKTNYKYTCNILNRKI